MNITESDLRGLVIGEELKDLCSCSVVRARNSKSVFKAENYRINSQRIGSVEHLEQAGFSFDDVKALWDWEMELWSHKSDDGSDTSCSKGVESKEARPKS